MKALCDGAPQPSKTAIVSGFARRHVGSVDNQQFFPYKKDPKSDCTQPTSILYMKVWDCGAYNNPTHHTFILGCKPILARYSKEVAAHRSSQPHTVTGTHEDTTTEIQFSVIVVLSLDRKGLTVTRSLSSGQQPCAPSPGRLDRVVTAFHRMLHRYSFQHCTALAARAAVKAEQS